MCGQKWPDDKLRQYKNIVANANGHIALGPVKQTIFRGIYRPGGATTIQLEELASVGPGSVKVQVCHLKKGLNSIGEDLVNLLGPGFPDAHYVFVRG